MFGHLFMFMLVLSIAADVVIFIFIAGRKRGNGQQGIMYSRG
jgi:hypothetical protein